VKRENLEVEGGQALEFRQVIAGHLAQTVDGGAELGEGRVVAVGQALFLGELPDPFGKNLLLIEVELELRVALAGDGGRFAMLQAQLGQGCRAWLSLKRTPAGDSMRATAAKELRRQAAAEPVLERVGDGVGVKFQSLGDEAVSGIFAVRADDQELDAVLVAQRWIVHRIFKVSDVGLGEFDAGHGL